MKKFESKAQCLQHIFAVLSEITSEDLNRMETFEREHYTDDDRADAAAIIADIEVIQPEVIEAYSEYLKRSGLQHKSMLRIETEKGKVLNVRRVQNGDKYGLNDCLTYESGPRYGDIIEFYDSEHATDTNERGYFISRYYSDTLLKSGGDSGTQGLCLEGSAPEYNVDAASMRKVIDWIKADGGKRQDL